MKTTKAILENTALSMKLPPRPSSQTSFNEKLIDRLFVRLGSIYPHIWKSQFNNNRQSVIAAKIEWGLALHRFTPVQIGQSIERCITVYDLPPTLPQFVKLCKTESRTSGDRSHQFYQPLPDPGMDRHLARERLQTLMASLKTKTNRQEV